MAEADASLLPAAVATAQRPADVGVLLEHAPLLALVVSLVGSENTGALGTSSLRVVLCFSFAARCALRGAGGRESRMK
jgi:hypothetical protein